MDDRGNTNSAMVAGIGEQLHDGRVHPHLARDCYHRRAGPLDSGAPSVVIER